MSDYGSVCLPPHVTRQSSFFWLSSFCCPIPPLQDGGAEQDAALSVGRRGVGMAEEAQQEDTGTLRAKAGRDGQQGTPAVDE